MQELLYQLVITYIHEAKFKKVMKNEQTVKRRVGSKKENNMRAKFQERVKELVKVMCPFYGTLLKMVL